MVDGIIVEHIDYVRNFLQVLVKMVIVEY